MSASDAFSALKILYDVTNKVKDNKDELLRLSRRIEHIVITIDDSRNRDIIRSDEYNDALTAVFDFITRAQRVAQRLLKRNLGDRTWHAGEISSELRRLNDDVQNYLSVHTVRALDLLHSSNVENRTVLTNNIEEIMVKVAELDYFLRTRTGDGWAPSIKSQAETNIASYIDETKNRAEQATEHIPNPPRALSVARIRERSSFPLLPPLPHAGTGTCPTRVSLSRNIITTNEHQDGVDFEGLIQSGKITVKVTNVRKDFVDSPLTALDLRLKTNVTQDEVIQAVKDAGFKAPTWLYEEPKLRISVTEGDSVYDAATPGGLKVNKSEPLLWWWNKYIAYHGLTPATTPRQTIAQLEGDPAGVVAGEALFLFHRTLRVPDGGISNLPASLGTFPLIPVDSQSRGVPPAVRERGGFLMPMFRREAIWLEFKQSKLGQVGTGPAVKISVGGVNALSGVSTHSIEPPKFDAEQDYIVVGQQPWLDGIVSGPGVIRQFVAADLGSGYTIEEQVTGKADIGGFQFDIFPRRPDVDGEFLRSSTLEVLDSISSPSELGMVADDQLVLKRPSESIRIYWSPANLQSRRLEPETVSRSRYQYGWSLSNYKRRVSPTATIEASYDMVNYEDAIFQYKATVCEMTIVNESPILGLAAGGKIAQKIYRDKNSPRVYDQERGHRFYVHIVTPEMWETITGVLPPITPVTRDMYIQNGVKWYKLFDDYVDSITAVSEALSNVLSVTQLDEQKSASSSQNQLPDLVDPNAPPGCSVHLGTTSSCVFRPCSHVACANCLGLAMLSGSKCPKCQAGIEKFVGMQTPLPVISQNTNQEGEWSVKEIETLAATAAGSDAVIIIHPLEDRPSPLYSSGH